MGSSQYQIRPMRHGTTDMSAIIDICALGNVQDELALYMTRDIKQKWTSYRNAGSRYLRSMVANPGCVCYVAESTTTHEVVGYAIWSRHGKSAMAKEWQRPNSGLVMALERKLIALEMGYYNRVPNVNPTSNREHKNDLMPILSQEFPEDIFPEFWELDALYVHPNSYRKGIGKMLVLWGVERGREEACPVLVKSSPQGKRLYESAGFAIIDRMWGFDAFVPEFMDGEEGCWFMGWEPEGFDAMERAQTKMSTKRKADGGKGASRSGARSVKTVTPVEAISVT